METCEVVAPVRGRPREFDADVALAAALRVFWQHGYEGASLTELTEAMGITRPSLYACFGNKEALFRKALDLYEREKMAYVSRALDEPSARAVAQWLLNGALEIQTSANDPKGCLGIISAIACGQGAESMRAEILARRASTESALMARFERARDEGDFPDSIEPHTLARYMMAVLQGMAVQAGAGVSPEDLKRVVDMTLAVWPGR